MGILKHLGMPFLIEVCRRLYRNIMDAIFVHDAHMYIYMRFVKNVP